MRSGPPTGGSSDHGLVGRADDLVRIYDFLGRGPGISHGATVLYGEAGAGKTVLLDAAVAAAADNGFRVLRAAGVEFEADVAYSGLNQVLLPLNGEIAALEPEHRDALRVALGFGAGPAPGRLVVSSAALVLLQRCATDRGLLVAVDDLQWIDRASAAVLAFIARRLSRGMPVRFLGAIRRGTNSFFEHGDLPQYDVKPLDEPSARRLVHTNYPDLAEPVVRRLLTEAQGNPLALLELPAALSQPQRTARTGLPTVLPLSARLEELFVERVARLPEPTRMLLLLATLDGTGGLGVLKAAAQQLTDHPGLTELAPAEADRLVHIDEETDRLTFRHPLTRSAVMAASSSDDRRRAHEALARALVNDPERQAWHLGLASVGVDETVAQLLERAARRKAARGDAVGAVAAFTRAAELSPGATDRAQRLSDAAYIGADAAGQLDGAVELLASARAADPDMASSLRAAAATAFVLINDDAEVETAHRMLVSAIETGDHGYAATDAALCDAIHALLLLCFHSGRAELWQPLHRIIAAVRPEPPALLRVSAGTFSDPARTAAPVLRQLDTLIAQTDQETDPSRIVRLGIACLYPDRLGDIRDLSWRVVAQGREGGPARRHIGALIHLCLDDLHTGRWDEAAALATEGTQLCERSGYAFSHWYFEYIQAMLAADRGEVDTNRALTDHMIRWAIPRGVGTAVHYARQARARAELAVGDFNRAFTTAAQISPPGVLASHVPHAMWAAMDLVEAAVRTQRHAEAAAHVRVLRESGIERMSSRLALIVAGATALASRDDSTAYEEYARALAVAGADRWTFDLARIKLAYGERLRRGRAPSQARGPLTEALEVFQRIGARPWAERAKVELRATRWPNDRPRPRADAMLTPQEREIATLAASGLTNRQIGERLFISHRTVGGHLHQIFRKLGISARTALRDALTDREDK